MIASDVRMTFSHSLAIIGPPTSAPAASPLVYGRATPACLVTLWIALH